jgi:hypothetical protein
MAPVGVPGATVAHAIEAGSFAGGITSAVAGTAPRTLADPMRCAAGTARMLRSAGPGPPLIGPRRCAISADGNGITGLPRLRFCTRGNSFLWKSAAAGSKLRRCGPTPL